MSACDDCRYLRPPCTCPNPLSSPGVPRDCCKKPKRNRTVQRFSCPDCGAVLDVESDSELPSDIFLRFVRHGG